MYRSSRGFPAILLFLFIVFAAPFVYADHTAIVSSFDTGKYSDTARLLEQLKTEDPVRYGTLPYALLHAKALERTKDLNGAAEIYRQVITNPKLAQFAVLPLARILVVQDKVDDAISTYQLYLRHVEYPEYTGVAIEALGYCVDHQKPEGLLQTAEIVQRNPAVHRLGLFYVAKSYLLRKDTSLARSLLLSLIQSRRPDDVTGLALDELDHLDGANLSDSERMTRGRLAYHVWDFDLAKKYLAPLAGVKLEYAYYYGRALFFEDDYDAARKVFQDALAKWPDDPMTEMALYQYANVCLKQGDYKQAQNLYSKVKSEAGSQLLENASYREVEALRSQLRFDDALRILQPFTSSRNSRRKLRAIFLRGRIQYQTGKYREALNDFQQLANSKSKYINNREVLFWKALSLEKLQKKDDALAIFQTLSTGNDFLAFLASEKNNTERGTMPSSADLGISTIQFPGIQQEDRILELYRQGELLPLLVYMHLYEDAANQLGRVGVESWNLLGINPHSRLQKYLAIAQIAEMGRNFSTATYYSEMFLKNLPHNISARALPEDVLKILFPFPYQEQVEKFSRERNVDPLLVLSIMKQESKFKPFAKSPAFARGLMQLIPPTAVKLATTLGLANFSVDQLYNPDVNINLGTKFLQDMIGRYGNRLEVIAAGYNSGESNVQRWLDGTSSAETIEFFSNIDLPETRNYVMLVKTNYEWYKRVYSSTPPQ